MPVRRKLRQVEYLAERAPADASARRSGQTFVSQLCFEREARQAPSDEQATQRAESKRPRFEGAFGAGEGARLAVTARHAAWPSAHGASGVHRARTARPGAAHIVAAQAQIEAPQSILLSARVGDMRRRKRFRCAAALAVVSLHGAVAAEAFAQTQTANDEPHSSRPALELGVIAGPTWSDCGGDLGGCEGDIGTGWSVGVVVLGRFVPYLAVLRVGGMHDRGDRKCSAADADSVTDVRARARTDRRIVLVLSFSR